MVWTRVTLIWSVLRGGKGLIRPKVRFENSAYGQGLRGSAGSARRQVTLGFRGNAPANNTLKIIAPAARPRPYLESSRRAHVMRSTKQETRDSTSLAPGRLLPLGPHNTAYTPLKYEAYFSQIVHRSHDLDVRRGGLLLHPIAATSSRRNRQK